MATKLRTTTDAKKHEEERSPDWERFRNNFIAKNPACVCCGKTQDQVGLQAHHVFPFHYAKKLGRPELELDERNLITLCETEAGKPSEDHHLLIGHLGDFESSNLDVRLDAKVFVNRTKDQIKNDTGWQQKHENKLPHLERMTADEQDAFMWAMQEIYPKPGETISKPTIKFPWLPKSLLDKI